MTTYNPKLCENLHKVTDHRLDELEQNMTALEKCGANHEQRLAIMETVAARQANVFWQLLSPMMSMAGGIMTGLILAYLLTK